MNILKKIVELPVKLGNLIYGIAAGFGLWTKTVHFKVTDPALFARSLPPCTPVFTRLVKAGFWHMFLSRAIQALTGCLWSHVLMYLGQSNGKYGLLHEIIEAVDEGVKSKSLDKYLNDQYQMEAWIIADLSNWEIAKIKEHLFAREGMVGYDYTGLLSPVTPFEQDPNRDYCSELVYNAFESAGRKYCDKDVNPKVMISPGDLRRVWKRTKVAVRITYNC